MSRGLRIPALIAWLTILWIALWGSLTWGNVAGGLAVAAGVVGFSRLDAPTSQVTRFRPLWALWYVAVVAWQLLVSNLRLAFEILTPRNGTHTAIVAVPIRGGSDAVINLVANSITLTPGTITIDVKRHDTGPSDADQTGPGATLYVHGIYARDPDVVRADVLRLEMFALRAFGTDEDRAVAERDLAEQVDRLHGDEP